jgi:hypothetical protein
MAVKAPLSTQSSKALFQKMSQYVPRAVSPLAPFIIAEGRGAVVKDLEGNSYIDLTGAGDASTSVMPIQRSCAPSTSKPNDSLIQIAASLCMTSILSWLSA